MVDTEIIMEQLLTMSLQYGPRLLGAIIFLIVGFKIIKVVKRSVSRMLERSKIDETLQPFLKSLIVVLLKILLFVSVLGMIGLEMTSFIALLGAAGLAVGMALSGTLQNFAGGVIILFFKPFKVGDFIEAQGYLGVVKEIQIFVTILKTTDNKTVFIPNGGLANSSLTNFTVEPVRRVECKFGISYGEDVDKVRVVLQNIIAADSRILNEPAEPFIAVSEMGDSSVTMLVRVWTQAQDFWGVYFDMQETVYKTFNKEGIPIPFPQMDVHVHKADA